MTESPSRQAPAIILGMHPTGLRTAWCLRDIGIEIHGVAFGTKEPGLLSRHIRHVRRFDLDEGSADIVDWLTEYVAGLPMPPVVFPIADAQVVALSRSMERLHGKVLTFSTPFDVIRRIVNKNGLYQIASSVGVQTPPAIVEPSVSELTDWCRLHPAPYLVKPYYQGISNASIDGKNRAFSEAKHLLDYVQLNGSRSLIVQRRLLGGDGYIFDCYGYCSREGHVVTMASHRRIRQRPVNTGTTCFGEIPINPDFPGLEDRIFEQTERLLAGLGYHGIFGIEWLMERGSQEIYLIDFNARPFSTINHLADCGLNLPVIAYRELAGHGVSDVPRRPFLKHKKWMAANRDWSSFQEGDGASPARWLSDLFSCRSHAFWRWDDPVPGLHELLIFVRRSFRKPAKKLRSMLVRRQSRRLV